MVPSPPFARIPRAAWTALRASGTAPAADPVPPAVAELAQRSGVPLADAQEEVAGVYQPLAQLLAVRHAAAGALRTATATLFGSQAPRVPFVVGVAGSVAVGKSTTSRLLASLLRDGTPPLTCDIVTTDGFLRSNAELAAQGLMARKGFPESYDLRGLVDFLAALKAGTSPLTLPVYSHHIYDIVAGAEQTVAAPDVVIVEGLNVLQVGGEARPRRLVSDFLDYSIYVDAPADLLARWFIARFARFRAAAADDPAAYFHRFWQVPEADALARAAEVWQQTNLANLEQNILPARERAALILEKGDSHRIEAVWLRDA